MQRIQHVLEISMLLQRIQPLPGRCMFVTPLIRVTSWSLNQPIWKNISQIP